MDIRWLMTIGALCATTSLPLDTPRGVPLQPERSVRLQPDRELDRGVRLQPDNQPPRLLVILVADQMRADYLETLPQPLA
jgi:hypothetical protein